MEGTQVLHGLSVYNLYRKPREDNYLIAVTRSGADNYGPYRSGLAENSRVFVQYPENRGDPHVADTKQ